METDIVGIHLFDKTGKMCLVSSTGTISNINSPENTFSSDAAYVLFPGLNMCMITGGKNVETRNAIAAAGMFSFATLGYMAVAEMPEAKFNHGACLLDSKVYVFGGKDEAVMRSKSAYVYNDGVWA
jgi:hypothetical protein